MTATGCPPGILSSSSVRVLPSSAPVPRVAKKPPDTPVACATSACPSTTILTRQPSSKLQTPARLALRAQLLEESIGEATPFFGVSPDAIPFEEEQLFGVFDRQHFEQHGVHQAEDSRIRADAERQRKRRHSGETRITTQHL